MITTSKSAELSWLLADQQGSIRDVVDDSGVLRKHVEYSAAGKIASETWYGQSGQQVVPTHAEAVDQLFYYTGLTRDSKTGFLRADQRDYDPQTGRWTSEDPIGFADGPNPFTAFGNSFPNATDPTGRSQQGNPLNNLFGSTLVGPSYGVATPYGGFSGGASVIQPKKVIPTVQPVSALPRAPVSNSAGILPGQVSFDFIDTRGPVRPAVTSIPSIGTPGEIQQGLRFQEELAQRNLLLAGPPRATFDDPILRGGGAALASPRVQGGLKVAQAASEFTVAAGLTYTGLGALAGPALIFHATDTLRAGARELTTGIPTQTVGSRAVEFLANSTGFGQQAQALGQLYDIGPALLAPATATRSATINPAPSTVQRTNAQLVQDIAVRAEAKVGGTGAVAGIAKHKYAEEVLDRYQRMFGDRGLQTEVSVIKREEVLYGRAGSVRLDVVEGPISGPTAVYDYKFGRSGLTPSRINQIQKVTDYGPSTFIIEVRP